MKYKEIGEYLVVDPQVCFGKLTFKGTRVPVETILTFLAKGYSFNKLHRNWPRVSKEAIIEAITLAGKALVEISGAVPTYGDLESPVPWSRSKSAKRRNGTRVKVAP